MAQIIAAVITFGATSEGLVTRKLNDILIQVGRPEKVEGRHVNMPIELESTMAFDTLAAFEAARDARYDTGTLYYGRYGNAATAELGSGPIDFGLNI